jgi:nicotinate-nucleotide adenylyltransferase
MSSRLGILGGMFDPVHNGHVAAARFAVESLDLDLLKMVPCHIPNHREQRQLSAQHRLKMLDLALRGESKIAVDDCEIRRGGVSYAVETVAEMRASGNWDQIVFVLGADALNGLPQWHKWMALLQTCHLFVLGRQNQSVAASVALEIGLEQRRVAKPEQLFEAQAGRIFIAEDFDVELSSTQVREVLTKGGEVAPLLDAQVYEYISRKALYGCNAETH